MTRELLLERLYHTSEATIGIFKDVTASLRNLLGFICEDQPQKVKVMKETRIPAGRYRLVLNKAETAKTLSYRKRYAWFKWHIMLEAVPGFTGVYIHVGNDDDDTEACLLVGDTANNIVLAKNADKMIQESTLCFERFYKTYVPLLEKNTPVYITIIDEKY
jgi:hypothetical protein